jgi:uncharacterized protein YegP (UPF0339 family)
MDRTDNQPARTSTPAPKRAWRISIFQDDAGQWRWRMKAANGEITATGEAHPTRGNAKRAALRMIEAPKVLVGSGDPS